jgi:LDH2 family malate/lactate/ureidoglycolate dehydrogenase
MAVYPESRTDRRIRGDDLTRVCAHIFKACGMKTEDAALLAETLVHSDMRGIHSHGVLRVPDYVRKLTQDGVDPRGRPQIVSERGAALVVDGANAMGQISGTFAMKQAIRKARDTGICLAAVRGSNHCGALDWYTLMAAEADMIGIAGTNALPTMAPWGGTEKIVGINPLSIAMPSADGNHFELDFAFGATAHGKIRVYHQKGSPIPEGWAFDSDGQPTTDAAKALEGLIQPIGAYKGVGLGMAIGMLSSLLSGAAYGTELGNMVDGAKPGLDGHFFMAINVDFFEDVQAFKQRVAAIGDQLRISRRLAGVAKLHVPGDIERDIAADYAANGILLAAGTINGILHTAAERGADAAFLA